MYMNLKPNQHKRISFNTTTMTSLGFIGPPKIQLPPKFNFLLRSPNYFGLELLGPPPLKMGGSCYHAEIVVYMPSPIVLRLHSLALMLFSLYNIYPIA